MYKKALRLVTKEFKGINDKAGAPYIEHLLTVSKTAAMYAQYFGLSKYKIHIIRVAGLLHDLIEDIPGYDYSKIKEEFNSDIAEIVDILSKKKGQSNKAYKNLVKSSLEASIIKAADASHNSDILRFKESEFERVHEKCQVYYELYTELIEHVGESVNGVKVPVKMLNNFKYLPEIKKGNTAFEIVSIFVICFALWVILL